MVFRQKGSIKKTREESHRVLIKIGIKISKQKQIVFQDIENFAVILDEPSWETSRNEKVRETPEIKVRNQCLSFLKRK